MVTLLPSARASCPGLRRSVQEPQDRNGQESSKQILMNHSGGNLGNHNAWRAVDSESVAHDVWGVGDGHDSIRKSRGHSCYILAKTLAAFCPSPENLNLKAMDYGAWWCLSFNLVLGR